VCTHYCACCCLLLGRRTDDAHRCAVTPGNALTLPHQHCRICAYTLAIESARLVAHHRTRTRPGVTSEVGPMSAFDFAWRLHRPSRSPRSPGALANPRLSAVPSQSLLDSSAQEQNVSRTLKPSTFSLRFKPPSPFQLSLPGGCALPSTYSLSTSLAFPMPLVSSFAAALALTTPLGRNIAAHDNIITLPVQNKFISPDGFSRACVLIRNTSFSGLRSYL
jgi:hypothetical protein